MKNRCYPKYSYLIFFILSFIMILFSIAPLLFFKKDEFIFKFIWSLITFISGLILLFGAFMNMQYFIIKDNFIMVICFGFVINKLKLSDCKFEVECLPTYFCWASSIKEKWICIYANEEKHFKNGCSNKIRENRIQIFCSYKNEELLKKYLNY